MEFDWPMFPAKVHHFIETGEVMHSVRVGKPQLVTIPVVPDEHPECEPLEWWETCFILGCGLALFVCVLLLIWNIVT